MSRYLLQMRTALAVIVLSGLFVCTAFAQGPCESCGPGEHWVDGCPGGEDLIDDQGAVIGIDLDLDCAEDASMALFPCPGSEPLTITRSGPLDDSMFFPGLRPLDGHLDVIDTEIVRMCLSGSGFKLTAGAGLGAGGVLAPSNGAIAEIFSSPPDFPAESFFDVFFEVETPTGARLYNQTALRLEAVIECVPPDDAAYIHPTDCIPLFTSPVPGQGEHAANLTSAQHLVNPGPSPVEDSTWGVIKALYR